MGQEQSTSETQVQWEWQSNANPWSSEKPQWAPYKPLDNYLLEKAYKNSEKVVDLGDFTVFIKDNDILQQRKNDASKQRRVRRNEKYFETSEELKMNEEEENSRKKRFFGEETPKTYCKAFGSLKDFLLFLENRGPDIKKFANVLSEIEVSKDFNYFLGELPFSTEDLSKN